jgi:ribosome-associated translation inhibitor RaiA
MTELEALKAQIKALERKVEQLERNTLYAIIEGWWSDVFTTNSTDDMETCIDTLVDRIETWLPKEQSAAGSQNVYVECTVEGFNDCLNKIKSKLR